MSLSVTAKWVLLALAGLAIAIGVAIAAANLTSQQIGIASESISAGDALAPSLKVPATGEPRGEGRGHGGSEKEPEPPLEGTVEPPSAAIEETAPPPEEATRSPETNGDDYGGRGSDGDD